MLPTIAVDCTGRGTHSRKVLGKLIGGDTITYQAQWWPTGSGGGQREGTTRFRCPVCPLDLKLGQDRLAPIFAAAVEAGMTRLDASRLG